MIGFYNYTVVLTYISLLCGTAGSMLCLGGVISPKAGMLFLMLSGICDSFDGMVARTKKGRSRQEQCFGVQIDSLADLMSFGMLPASVGIAAMLRGLSGVGELMPWSLTKTLLLAVGLAFVLAALIRLAYFNVLEEERSRTGKGRGRKCYVGLPTTSVALIFPAILLIQHYATSEALWPYFVALGAVAYLFVSKIEIPKPRLKGLLALIGVGAIEFGLMLSVIL